MTRIRHEKNHGAKETLRPTPQLTWHVFYKLINPSPACHDVNRVYQLSKTTGPELGAWDGPDMGLAQLSGKLSSLTVSTGGRHSSPFFIHGAK